MDEFHNRLQIAANYCDFGDKLDKELKAQIEFGTSDKKLRRHSFRYPELKLADLLAYARTMHETGGQAI